MVSISSEQPAMTGSQCGGIHAQAAFNASLAGLVSAIFQSKCAATQAARRVMAAGLVVVRLELHAKRV